MYTHRSNATAIREYCIGCESQNKRITMSQPLAWFLSDCDALILRSSVEVNDRAICKNTLNIPSDISFYFLHLKLC